MVLQLFNQVLKQYLLIQNIGYKAFHISNVVNIFIVGIGSYLLSKFANQEFQGFALVRFLAELFTMCWIGLLYHLYSETQLIPITRFSLSEIFTGFGTLLHQFSKATLNNYGKYLAYLEITFIIGMLTDKTNTYILLWVCVVNIEQFINIISFSLSNSLRTILGINVVLSNDFLIKKLVTLS
jgi:hypothetical protein